MRSVVTELVAIPLVKLNDILDPIASRGGKNRDQNLPCRQKSRSSKTETKNFVVGKNRNEKNGHWQKPKRKKPFLSKLVFAKTVVINSRSGEIGRYQDRLSTIDGMERSQETTRLLTSNISGFRLTVSYQAGEGFRLTGGYQGAHRLLAGNLLAGNLPMGNLILMRSRGWWGSGGEREKGPGKIFYGVPILFTLPYTVEHGRPDRGARPGVLAPSVG